MAGIVKASKGGVLWRSFGGTHKRLQKMQRVGPFRQSDMVYATYAPHRSIRPPEEKAGEFRKHRNRAAVDFFDPDTYGRGTTLAWAAFDITPGCIAVQGEP